MYEQDIPAVYEILRKGSEAARAEAAKTLDEVRRAMQINYFEDADLIAEHTKKYKK
jgi:tryptophanyl-tRNA synthetase